MQGTDRPRAIIWCLGLTVAALPLHATAQESMLAGLGWHKNSAGTQMDGASAVRVQGNRSAGPVVSTGSKGSALANAGMRVDLAGTAQAHAAGIAGMELRQSRVHVLANQVTGFVHALGGAATANVVLAAGSTGTQPLTSSDLVVQGNRAAGVAAFGAKSEVLLGTGSVQMPGRASANSVLLDATAARHSQVRVSGNTAQEVTSIGGAALANGVTAARSTLVRTEFTQTGNEATDVRAGGGAGGVGRGTIAQVELTGVAAANTVSLASSDLTGARLLQAGNKAAQVAADGASALANSLSFTEHRTDAAGGYTAVLTGNEATEVRAWGGAASILRGALADVRMSATALANSVSVTRGALRASPQHGLAGNHAQAVVASGGAAVANSLWLDDATVEGGVVQIAGNRATQVQTAGATGSMGGGGVAGFERNGRGLANAVVADRQSTLAQVRVALAANTAQQIRGAGGLAAANALLLSEGRIQQSNVALSANRAEGVGATGFAAQAGGGVLFFTAQNALALANALAVTGGQLDAPQLAVLGNTAAHIESRGGVAMANSVALEHGDGQAARLSGSGAIVGNTAKQIRTEASSASAGGGVVSRTARARAAANALVLHDGAMLDAASSWSVSGNQARGVQARGGTALVNSLAAYRGARVRDSRVGVAGNVADGVVAEGGSSQVLDVGRRSNGVLAANALYLDGAAATELSGSTLVVAGNQARQLQAQGGRVNANALALNGQGRAQASSVTLAGNTASGVRSQGRESTVAGMAWGTGVGQANASAVQVLGQLRAASIQLAGNLAANVRADEGMAAANSFVQGDGTAEVVQLILAGNAASGVQARDGRVALANSVQTEGRLQGSSVQLVGNQGGADAGGSRDALANSLRVRQGSRVRAAQVTAAANQGTARNGTVNSADMAGSLHGGSITILGNLGQAGPGGVVNSVVGQGSFSASQVTVLGNRGTATGGSANSVRNEGSIAAASITILGNQASVQGGGRVNALDNIGSLRGGQVLIAGNTGSAQGAGTVNSVRNSGSIQGGRIVISGNHGTASGGGLVNSVDNRGMLTGQVVIAGNRGGTAMGGTVNSVVNQGVLTGTVAIIGNQGRATAGGVSNSLINHGVVSGTVAIVGNATTAGPGMTAGSVRNVGGAITGAAGVAGNAAFAANPGYTYTVPSSGVVNQSVTVLPAVNLLSM